MKFTKLTSLFILLACSVLWLGNKDGRANGGNEGATGAPNDNPTNRTCQNCHNNSSSLQVTLDIEVYNANDELVDSYNPGENYLVKVRLNSVGNGTPSAYGFQMTALQNNLTPVNTWFAPEAGVQITTLNNGRAYAEHLNPSTDNVFEINWTAPDAGAGDVTFYSCGNGVNGNNQSSGDGAAINQLTLTEEGGGTVSTKEQLSQKDLTVYPNPTTDLVYLDIDDSLTGNARISLMDQLGRMISTQNQQLLGGETIELPLNGLSSGLYFLRLETENGQISKRLLVQ
ncbi:MAG: T9SS type A sorting domain-containing protein [Bacteroidetes bacterium]|nr:T9SS type A sorting domain-containing protein [Bacteroidota bacterium]